MNNGVPSPELYAAVCARVFSNIKRISQTADITFQAVPSEEKPLPPSSPPTRSSPQTAPHAQIPIAPWPSGYCFVTSQGYSLPAKKPPSANSVPPEVCSVHRWHSYLGYLAQYKLGFTAEALAFNSKRSGSHLPPLACDVWIEFNPALVEDCLVGPDQYPTAVMLSRWLR